MKKRLVFLFLYFFTFFLILILQKPLFMLYNGACEKGLGIGDFLQVIWHGASLDAAVVGYLILVPYLGILVSVWLKSVPLRKILYSYYVLASVVVSVIFIVDMGLYPFWGFKLDSSIFLYLDSPKEVFASVSVSFLLIRIMFMLLLAAVILWVLLRITPRKLQAVNKKLIHTFVLLLVGGGLFVIIRGGVTESTSNIGQVYFSDNQFLNHSAVNPQFSLLSSLSDPKDFASEFNFYEEEERASLFEGLYPVVADGDSTMQVLNTKRPNVLLIILEGFGGAFVEPLGGLPDVAPNLNRLSQEGIFFTRCYANSYRTDRGVVSTLSGYLALPTVSVMKIPVKSRTLPAISEELLKAGYQTDFLYGGDINFTNMKSYLLAKGYQRLTADTDFSLAEQSSNAWGVNDDITFEHLYRQLERKKDTPWFTTFLTLSSHEPFEVPYHFSEDKVVNAFAYTDHCLGKLIDRLKQQEIWKDLLVVCIPDHGFCYPRGTMDRGGEFAHIPMLWLGGAVKEPMVVDKIMNQTDLAATFLGQLDLDHSMFAFSRNVLSSAYKYPFAFYSSGSYFAFRDSTGASAYDLKGNSVSYEEPADGGERLNKGKAILQSIYDDLAAR